jgi:hypothetical protein
MDLPVRSLRLSTANLATQSQANQTTTPMAFTLTNGGSSIQAASDDIKTLENKLTSLRGAMIDELCALRRDLDTVRLGHWKVDMGPFVYATEQGDAAGLALYHQLMNKLGVSKSSVHLILTPNSHNGDNISTVIEDSATTEYATNQGISYVSTVSQDVCVITDTRQASEHEEPGFEVS